MSPEAADRATGRIITFYSYKGGTGRTMALANMAWILASNGYRVLTVDWDLESPGLHRYFHPFLRDKELRATDGMIDLVRRYSQAVVDAEQPLDVGEFADIDDLAVSLDWEFGDGRLDFVGAGRQEPASYSTAVSTFDWEKFWNVHNGGAFLEELRRRMCAEYDYVLIDSRTGLSDTAGICTVHLPDTVVVCFTLNTQSVEGAAAVARSMKQARQSGPRPLRIYPVPTRVEDGEQRKLDRGRSYAHRSFTAILDLPSRDEVESYWGTVELPYRPYYAYEEVLATIADRPNQENSLLAPYLRLASRVTGLALRAPVVAEAARTRALTQFELPEPVEEKKILINYVPLDRIYAEWIGQRLAAAGHRPVLHFAGAPLPDVSQFDRVLALISRDYDTFAENDDLTKLCAKADPGGTNGFLLPVQIDGTPAPAGMNHGGVVDFVGIGGDRAWDALCRAIGIPAAVGDDSAEPDLGIRYPALSTPHWNVKLSRNSAFSGRHRLIEELRERLLGTGPAGGRIVLGGINGVGKTQIALEYAYRFAAAYDVVWWISAEQTGRVRTVLADLAVRLGLGGGTTADERIDAVKEHLRRGDPARRWLVVFDNADLPEELQDFLPSGPGHVIVTSRHPYWQQKYHLAALDVNVFARGESTELLTRRVPSLGPGDASRIADNLGDLPLALEQAAAWLSLTGMSAGSYLEQLAAQTALVLDREAPPDQLSTTGSVRVSFDRLRQHNPAAARLLELFAFLAPEAIPYRIVESDLLSDILARVNQEMRSPLMQATLISEIGRYALARIDSATRGLVVHRLTQRIIRDSLRQEEQQENRELVGRLLAAANRGKPEDRDNWALYEELRSHLEASGALESGQPDVRELCINMVQYLRYRGDYQSGLDLAEKALTKWKAFGPDDVTTLRLRFELGNVFRARGQVDRSYEIDSDVVAQMTKTLGERHPYTLMAAGGLAADERERGDFAMARTRDERTVELIREVLGPNHDRTLNAVNNLAVSLRLVGDTRAALTYDVDSLARRRRHLGAGDQRTDWSLDSYGRDLRDTGQVRQSRDTLEDVATARRSSAPDVPLTWLLVKNLAVTLRRLGEYVPAHAYAQESATRLATLLGPRHPDAIASELELACGLWALGQTGAARPLAAKVHEYYRKRWGNQHPFTLIAAVDLSVIQRADGDRAGAQVLAEEAARQLEVVFGSQNPFTLIAQMSVANGLYADGAVVEAHRRDQDVYRNMTAVLGERHWAAVAAEVNLAISGRSLSDGPQEQAALEKAAQHSAEWIYDDHPFTAAARRRHRIEIDVELQPT